MNISSLTPLRHAAPLAALALLPLLPQTTLADAVGKRYTSMAAGDLDGDGVLDRVFGYPNANGTEGKVVVVYGTEAIEMWNRDVPGILASDAVGNYLGDSIAVADFDGDGYDDLAIGVPGDDTSAGTNVGSITAVYGSSGGLSNVADQLITQNTPGIGSSEESYDYYGEFLQAGDFDCDGYADLVVGIPQEDLSAGVNGGAVNVIYGSAGGISSVDDWFHQNTTDVTGAVQPYDRFGAALAAGNYTGDTYLGNACDDLIVGVPDEDIGHNDVGAMQLFPGNSAGLDIAADVWFRQAYQGAAGIREAYDEFGAWLYTTATSNDGYADVAVRVPGDACEAGGLALQVFDGESTGLDNGSDELVCVNLSGELGDLADTFTTCVLEPGYCHCSEEFRFAVEDTDLAPRAIEPWMCIEKLRAAADFCEDAPTQSGPTLSVIAADCIEASAEAWDGCDFGTVEGDQ